MNITDTTPRNARQIGGKRPADSKFAPGTEVAFTLQVPAPITLETPLTEGMVAVLNQTLAENVSNNLRAKLLAGKTEGEGDAAKTRELTEAEAQALVDSYVAEYEFGVRRAGNGEPRVTDPVEKEARSIAREKAKELVAQAGAKQSDVDMAQITNQVFDANKDYLMAEAKKIVDSRAKKSAGITLEGINLTPKAAAAPAEPAAS